MIERRLRRQLSDALTRYRRTLLAKRLAIGWLILAAMAGLLIAANLNSGFYVRGAIAAFIALSVMFTLAIYYLTWPAASSTQRIAKRIEAQYPELETRLLTAIEQQPQLPGERYGYLQQNVIQEAVVHGYHHDWRNIVPTWRYGLTHLVCLLALAALVTSTVGLFRYIEPTEQDWLSVFVPNRSEPRTPTKLVEIEPGNAAIERGTGLLVLAHFSGGLPKDVSLIVTQSQSDDARQIPMNQSLHDPTFGGRVRAIDAPLDYRIVYDGRRSDLFHIDVFEYPALQQADANLDFPDYTGKESTLVQDVRHVTAVEGTEVTLLCQLNKPVTEATLQGGDESPLALMADSAAPALYKITISLTRSRRLKLYLKDDLGRENKHPPEFILTAIPNLRPTVQMQFPSRDVEVSPLEELQLTARVSDDFGVARYGLRYQMGDGDEQELVLGTSGVACRKDHRLSPVGLRRSGGEARPVTVLLRLCRRYRPRWRYATGHE